MWARYPWLGAGIDPGLVLAEQLVVEGSRGVEGYASLAQKYKLFIQGFLQGQLHHVSCSSDERMAAPFNLNPLNDVSVIPQAVLWESCTSNVLRTLLWWHACLWKTIRPEQQGRKFHLAQIRSSHRHLQSFWAYTKRSFARYELLCASSSSSPLLEVQLQAVHIRVYSSDYLITLVKSKVLHYCCAASNINR